MGPSQITGGIAGKADDGLAQGLAVRGGNGYTVLACSPVPHRLEPNAGCLIDHHRGPRALGIGGTQAGGVPGNAPCRIGRSVHRVQHHHHSAIGMGRPGLLRITPSPAPSSTSMAAASAARSDRYWLARVPARPQSSRLSSDRATAVAAACRTSSSEVSSTNRPYRGGPVG